MVAMIGLALEDLRRADAAIAGLAVVDRILSGLDEGVEDRLPRGDKEGSARAVEDELDRMVRGLGGRRREILLVQGVGGPAGALRSRDGRDVHRCGPADIEVPSRAARGDEGG